MATEIPDLVFPFEMACPKCRVRLRFETEMDLIPFEKGDVLRCGCGEPLLKAEVVEDLIIHEAQSR